MPFILTKPLKTHKTESISKVKALAGDKILSVYPIYKQLNIARTEEAPTMYAYIDLVRSLSNLATDSITSAIDIIEIRAIETKYTIDLGCL